MILVSNTVRVGRCHRKLGYSPKMGCPGVGDLSSSSGGGACASSLGLGLGSSPPSACCSACPGRTETECEESIKTSRRNVSKCSTTSPKKGCSVA